MSVNLSLLLETDQILAKTTVNFRKVVIRRFDFPTWVFSVAWRAFLILHKLPRSGNQLYLIIGLINIFEMLCREASAQMQSSQGMSSRITRDTDL